VASTARPSGGRPTQAKSRRAGGGKSTSAAAKRSSSSANSRSSKRPSPATSGSRSRSAASANRSRSTRSTSSNGSGNGAVSTVTETLGSAAQKASTPLVAGGAAAAGLVGGLVLGKRVLGPRRTVFGFPIARRGLSLKPVAREVGKAGKQIGRLTDELTQARKQAKKVGNALS
jgi:hypothetical protein